MGIVMPSANVSSEPRHLLLTVLGTNPRFTCYTLEDREAGARLAPIALLGLLPKEDQPNGVLALCTAEAERDSLPFLEATLGSRFPIRRVAVPAGNAQQDVERFLVEVVGAVGDGVELTVDVTHGLRHFSFLTYVAVLYLAALRGVRIRGAYYGMLNPDPAGPSSFLDLRPLIELPRWTYALEVLRDTGSALPMARTLLDGPASQPAQDNARDLGHLSEAYLSALPLELGWQARNVLDHRRRPLRRLLRDDHRLPLAEKLLERLAEHLEPLALSDSISAAGWKRSVRLSTSELKRQARLVDDLLVRKSYATALRLMREWLVSWAIHQQQGPNDDWLNREVRQRAERLLHAIHAIGGDPELCGRLTEEQRKLGRFWGDLAEVRNAHAHHGMRSDDLVRSGKIVAARDRVVTFWSDSLRSCPGLSLSLGESPGDRVLVSPVGRRPGVLFSAVQAVREAGQGGDPSLCLVICSRETETIIAEAFERADFAGAWEPAVLEDPLGGGRAEIERVVKAARGYFIGVDEVFVNVTGGTTLMGLAAEAMAGEARSLACPVRRFGLIDRRSPSQQDSEPYQAGEPFWLDPAEEEDAGRD